MKKYMGRYLRHSGPSAFIPDRLSQSSPISLPSQISEHKAPTDNSTHFHFLATPVLRPRASSSSSLPTPTRRRRRRRRLKPWTSKRRLGSPPPRRPSPALLTTFSPKPASPSRRSLPGFSPSRRTARPSQSSASSSPRCRSSSSRSAKYVTLQNPTYL
jgi:hypothetical protein